MIINNNLIICNNLYKLINQIYSIFSTIKHISCNIDKNHNIIDFNIQPYNESISWKIFNKLNDIFIKFKNMGIIEYDNKGIINIFINHNNSLFNIFTIDYSNFIDITDTNTLIITNNFFKPKNLKFNQNSDFYKLNLIDDFLSKINDLKLLTDNYVNYFNI